MNTKRFIITGIVVFIVYEILSYITHMVILKGAYEATSSLWRPTDEINSMMWITLIGGLVWSFFLVYIFTKGYEAKGWIEGLRFGLIIGLFITIPSSLMWYYVLPIPFSLAVYWFIYETIAIIICGIVTALIYKPAQGT